MVAQAMDPQLMLEGIRYGVKAYVTEPLTRQELEAAIRNVVNNRPTPGTAPVFAFDDAFFKGIVARTPDRPPLLASSDRLMAVPLDPRRVQAEEDEQEAIGRSSSSRPLLPG